MKLSIISLTTKTFVMYTLCHIIECQHNLKISSKICDAYNGLIKYCLQILQCNNNNGNNGNNGQYQQQFKHEFKQDVNNNGNNGSYQQQFRANTNNNANNNQQYQQQFHANTNLLFVERTSERDYVRFIQTRDVNSSDVGRQGGEQIYLGCSSPRRFRVH